MVFLLGVFAFALLFWSDYNDWKLARRGWTWCFPAGAVLLAAATVLGMGRGHVPLNGWPRVLCFALAFFFMALLVHALFFALPTEASYARPGEDRGVVARGQYALCRHPGVLWFVGLYACLGLAAALPFGEAAAYSGLNVILAAFEDRCVFPARLAGYEDYRRTTPFLIPNARSIRAALAKHRGEEDSCGLRTS